MNIPYVFKKCSKCGRWLVASKVNFYKNKNGKYGLSSWCKDCMKDYNKNYYEEKEKHYIESIKNNSGEHTVLYKKCTKCGRLLVANTNNFHKRKDSKDGLGSWCKECENARCKKYKKEHKEELAEYAKKYCQVHKEEKRGYYKKYNKKYYEENKEYYAERSKEYCKTPQGQASRFNARVKRRKREQRGNGITGDQWLEMIKFFDWKCAYSGEYIGGINGNKSVDHIVPLAKGGAHEIWNCVPMDRSLNCSKKEKDLEEWYTQQDFYNEDRLNKINEWCEYAYNKWGKEVNTKAI